MKKRPKLPTRIKNVGPHAHAWLTDLLYRHDPIKLAKCGVPKDEYTYEAASILEELKDEDKRDSDTIFNIVFPVFAKAFGPCLGSYKNYLPIVKEMASVMKRSPSENDFQKLLSKALADKQ